jgi:3-methyladenine DNA glycosylase AlkD
MLEIQKELRKLESKEKAMHSKRFFKTGKGEYGEGDKFLGIVVPEQRKIAKKHKELPLKDLIKLLHSPYHEERLTAIFILVHQYKNNPDEIYKLYLANAKQINNWDLVDSSAHKIVGRHLLPHPEKRQILYKLAESPDLWERRISIISCFAFIDQKDLKDTIAISEILLQDHHDLIHKAVGWMLRELGKVDQELLEKFLQKHLPKMPRTMLRYAIEKLPEKKRQSYLKK